MNTYSVTDDTSIKCSTFVDALMCCQLTKSRTEARTLIASGGCYVNDIRLTEDRQISTDNILYGKWILLRRGKKTYSLIQFNNLEMFFQNEI